MWQLQTLELTGEKWDGNGKTIWTLIKRKNLQKLAAWFYN